MANFMGYWLRAHSGLRNNNNNNKYLIYIIYSFWVSQKKSIWYGNGMNIHVAITIQSPPTPCMSSHMSLSHALKHTNKRSLILVFPEQNHAKFQLPNAPSKYKSPYGNILFSAWSKEGSLLLFYTVFHWGRSKMITSGLEALDLINQHWWINDLYHVTWTVKSLSQWCVDKIISLWQFYTPNMKLSDLLLFSKNREITRGVWKRIVAGWVQPWKVRKRCQWREETDDSRTKINDNAKKGWRDPRVVIFLKFINFRSCLNKRRLNTPSNLLVCFNVQ